MTVSQAIIPLFTHFIPILFFVFMLTDVILRNYKKTEHWLAGGIIFCCMMLFTEEFVRHQLPIAYSPIITVTWFSTAGIVITGLGMHLFVKLTRLEHKMPKIVYPYLFYLPVVIVLLNLLLNDQMISGNEFHQVGIWKLPVYNEAYYIAMIGSNVFNVVFLIILARGKANTGARELKAIYNQLMFGIIVTAVFNLAFGLIDFKGYFPPYPYIYGCFAWCILLRHTMVKYDFLNHIDKRYEKLFNLNPAAIMLIDQRGNVKEANPSARQLLDFMQLGHDNVFTFFDDDMKRRISSREQIRSCEMSICSGDRQIDVLIDGDYVLVEFDPHLIIIMRDVTIQKENQREITFLAYHDALTRLPNRRYFHEKMEAALEDATRNSDKLAVVLFDLDCFKEINDKYGHHVGDRVLLHVADVLRESISPYGTTARHGGDEFVFFLHPAVSAAMVEEKIRQLQHALDHRKLIVEGEHIPVRLSIGASLFPDNGFDVDSLLNSADKALYHVKRQGRNHYHMLAASE